MHVLGFFLTLIAVITGAADLQVEKRSPVILGTATPGGGFELYGAVLADVVNEIDERLSRNSQKYPGQSGKYPILEQGALDIAFVVKGDSPAQHFSDLVGKRVAWGTGSSGLTLLGKYVTEALGLDADKDFDPVYLKRAGDGAPMVLKGEVAALWGGGVGWPNFTKVMEQGGRLVGLTDEQINKVTAKHPFLQSLDVPAGSYPGQQESLKTVGSFSFLLARADLPDDLAYRLAKAIHMAQPGLEKRLTQGRDTLPANTWKAAGKPERIHPGVRRYLAEIGLK